MARSHYWSFTFLLLAGQNGGCSEHAERAVSVRAAALIDESLVSEVDTDAPLPVIVNLSVPQQAEDMSAAIAAAQARLLAKNIQGFSVTRRYKHVAALAGRASAQAIEALAHQDGVSFVQRDHVGGGQLKEAVPAVGGDQVRTLFGLSGRGVRVAVLDTGIDTDHPDLRDAVVAQHCFTQFACPPFGAESTSAEDDHGHGSNVTGIIASDGVVSARGFAPASEIVAVKINDSNDSGQESDWVAGMDWVYDNLATNKVKLVNLSIGTNALYESMADCDRAHPALAGAIKNLVDKGVSVFAATGNRGSTRAIGAPACNNGVIAVGAVYDSSAGRQPPLAVGNTYAARWGSAFGNCSDAQSAFDQIACFTNSNARMDLVAPGAPIVSDSLRGRTEEYWGTSQAAPAAVGVAALLLECNPALTPAQIKQTLLSTGVSVKDARNGLSFPSLRALAAVRAVCSEDPDVPASDAGTALSDAGARDASVTVTDASPSGAPSTPTVMDAATPMLEAGSPSSDATVGVTSEAGAQPGYDTSGTGSGLAGSAKTSCDCALARAQHGPQRAGGSALSMAFVLALAWRRRRSAPAARLRE